MCNSLDLMWTVSSINSRTTWLITFLFFLFFSLSHELLLSLSPSRELSLSRTLRQHAHLHIDFDDRRTPPSRRTVSSPASRSTSSARTTPFQHVTGEVQSTQDPSQQTQPCPHLQRQPDPNPLTLPQGLVAPIR